MKVKCEEKPNIFITAPAKERLDLYLQLCDLEISGLGRVVRQNGHFIINEILLFNQEVTAGSTDLDEETISKFLFQSVKKGYDPSNLKLWWHSHVNGGCFWSGTDEGTAGRFKNDWMISIVGNKRGDYMSRIDIYSPVRVTLDEISIEVIQSRNERLAKQVEAEINKKVKKKEFNWGEFAGPYQPSKEYQTSFFNGAWDSERYRKWNENKNKELEKILKNRATAIEKEAEEAWDAFNGISDEGEIEDETLLNELFGKYEETNKKEEKRTQVIKSHSDLEKVFPLKTKRKEVASK